MKTNKPKRFQIALLAAMMLVTPALSSCGNKTDDIEDKSNDILKRVESISVEKAVGVEEAPERDLSTAGNKKEELQAKENSDESRRESRRDESQKAAAAKKINDIENDEEQASRAAEASKAEEEYRRKAEESKKKAEEESKKKAEEESKKKAEEESQEEVRDTRPTGKLIAVHNPIASNEASEQSQNTPGENPSENKDPLSWNDFLGQDYENNEAGDSLALSDEKFEEQAGESININMIEKVEGVESPDAKEKAVEVPTWNYSFISDLKVPDYMGKALYADIYTKLDQNSTDYDYLYQHSIYYENAQDKIKLFIDYSQDNLPLSDYKVNGEMKVSSIDKIEVTFSRYKTMLRSQFNVDGIYFQIEAVNMNTDDFIDIVRSIIKR